MTLSKVAVLDFPNVEDMFEGSLPLNELQMKELRQLIPDGQSYNWYPKTGSITVRAAALPIINKYLYELNMEE